ncbi:MoxR family ATPase [Sulfidibacter corallicola]|uniref:MoxR family ATPase n=1 Tax=Sulfidibacter corallicola TaxID=2818388 RepID=A0A8A4TK35_SULCO|nr:MoxR family ATPase [Sulfidibacter corallicola]QTD49910.1 MoxR family ATPase [Sulfidibacter corallicola]
MSQPQTSTTPETSQIRTLLDELETLLLGKRRKLEYAVTCLLAEGHLLIEDVPGVGKTTLAKSLAGGVKASFKRVQFTSDLLPSDLIGVTVFHQARSEFEFKKGPIFTNVLLADEINRANPKTQSALLEAMHDAQISHDGETHQLPQPFFVVATQNSKDNHGTFSLPESQLDRFLMKIHLGYPAPAYEKRVLKGDYRVTMGARARLSLADLQSLQAMSREVHVSDEVLDFIYRVVKASREHAGVLVGVSPRGGMALYRACQALALVRGRDFVIPDDVRELTPFVCAHRVLLNHSQIMTTVNPDESALQIFREIIMNLNAPS